MPTPSYEVMQFVFQWLGILGAIGILLGFSYLVGALAALVGNYMLTQSLRVVRLANWRYWNARMQKEGLIAMSKFYQEQVAVRKPKTIAEWSAVDRDTEGKE